MTPENGKANELHKCVLDLSQKLDLRSSNKHVTFQISSFCCTQINVRQQCKNKKLEIIATMWSDELELPDGSYSVSDIQNYIE